MIVVTTTVQMQDGNGKLLTLPPKDNFGAWLKAQARKHDLTLKDIADRCGVSKQAASLWARDINRPSIDKLALLAEMFDTKRDTRPEPAPKRRSRRSPVMKRSMDVLSAVEALLLPHAG